MMYVSQIIMLYTLNLYRAVRQLYLNKTGSKILSQTEDSGPWNGPDQKGKVFKNWYLQKKFLECPHGTFGLKHWQVSGPLWHPSFPPLTPA